MSRNKARLSAMKVLFQLDTGLDGLRRVMDCCVEEEQFTERDIAYLNNLIQNIIDNKKAVDEVISRYSIDWDISRLGKVERAILRLAVGEILYIEDVPVNVAISEAVLLAKKFGSDNASKFINGILGSYSREAPGEDKKGDVMPTDGSEPAT